MNEVLFVFAGAMFLSSTDEGTGPIFFSGFLCTGRESRLEDCSRLPQQPPSTYSGCQHSQDVGIMCTGTYKLYILISVSLLLV